MTRGGATRRAVLALAGLALAACAVGALLWPAPPREGRAAARPQAAPPVGAEEERSRSSSARATGGAGSQARADARPAAGDRSSVEPALVDCRLVLPASTPADERVEVVLRAGRGRELRAAVAADGRFALPAGELWGTRSLGLSARYLYFPFVTGAPRAGAANLYHPLLGACVAGRATVAGVPAAGRVLVRGAGPKHGGGASPCADGRFEIGQVPPGDDPVLVLDDPRAPLVLVALGTLAPGELRRVELDLPSAVALRGRAVDGRGRGVGDLEARGHWHDERTGLAGWVSARTSADGRFLLERVADRALTLELDAPQGDALRLELDLTGSGAVHELGELILPGAGSLRGRVLWSGGGPAAGCEVLVRERAGTGWRSAATTDTGGAFQIAGAQAIAVRARARDAGGRTWIAPVLATAGREELELRLAPATRLVLGVAGAGGPLEGAEVRVWVAGEDDFERATTDALGSALFDALPAATAHAVARTRGGSSAILELALVPGEFEATLTVEPWARIEGRVVDAEGAPLAGLHVVCEGPQHDLGLHTRFAYWHLAPQEDVTLTDGSLLLGDLPPGEWRLRVLASSEHGPIVERLRLAPGAVARPTLVARPGASIEGTLPEGGEARVELRGPSLAGEGPRWVLAERGRFAFTGLAPGPHEVSWVAARAEGAERVLRAAIELQAGERAPIAFPHADAVALELRLASGGGLALELSCELAELGMHEEISARLDAGGRALLELRRMRSHRLRILRGTQLLRELDLQPQAAPLLLELEAPPSDLGRSAR